MSPTPPRRPTSGKPSAGRPNSGKPNPGKPTPGKPSRRKDGRGKSRQGSRAGDSDPRVAAVRLMAALDDTGGSLTRSLPLVLAALDPGFRARCQGWCYGLARWHLQLEALVGRLMRTPLKAKDADLAWLIELGLYQLRHGDAPAGSVVDETVEATVTLGKEWAKGLVNAVLRRAIREADTLGTDLPDAVAVAHPDWLHAMIVSDWPEQAAQVFEANNRQAPMVLRVAGDREAYRAELADAGFDSSPLELAEQALELARPVPVERLPRFDVGAVSVQDVSAQLATRVLIESLPSGGRLLDACAAPGGKTAHALETGLFDEVVALDSDATRLERVAQTLARLGRTEAATLVHADAADTSGWWDGRAFDAVLIDAPCSGSGVIRRHPDIKLLRRAQDIEALVAQQARLLDALWAVLAPGGRLVYATCSVLKAENEEQVAAFLTRTPDARVDELSDALGLARPNGRQRLPGVTVGDGFWYARLLRTSAA